jgi:putative membrane protein
MHGYGNGWMWPMGGMMIGWVLLTALVVGLVVWLVVSYARPRPSVEDTGAARRILAERYASGELDTDDYQQRLAALHR